MDKVSIIAGTNRSGSNTMKVARSCREIMDSLGQNSEIFSLEDLPRDFLFKGLYGDRSVLEPIRARYFQGVERLVFVIPEYHGSFPGVLKVFMDALDSDDVRSKKALLVGLAAGHAGALRPLGQFTEVLHHLKMEVYSGKPKLSHIEGLVDSHRVSDQNTLKRLEDVVQGYLKF